MSRAELVRMMQRNVDRARAGTVDLVPDVARVPASHYVDPERWRLEVDRVFKRLPLVLALSCELRGPGAYKAIDAAGVPVLLVRGDDGIVRAFVNTCSHRGAIVVEPGSGSARRFACPYHAWTYDREGRLVGILLRDDFGPVDTDCLGLTPLPCGERAGLVFVTLDPASTLDLDTHLCGYDEYLAHFGFDEWHVVTRRSVPGPNWKVAYDGYLDLYHLPILHRDSFGPNMPNRAIYDVWGPHQRATAPHEKLLEAKTPVAEWPTERLLGGVWTIFPHVSIATFDAGGRGILLSQLFPGESADSSVTLQSYVLDHEPTDVEREEAEKMADFLERVVRDEDYATGLGIQRAIRTGAKPEVLFGRNEGGGQRFHGWVDRLVALGDPAGLAELYASTG